MHRSTLFAVLLLLPGIALAGPWCRYMDEDEVSCNFNSAEQCMRAAGKQGGYCRPDKKEYGAKGDAPLCLLTSTMRNCSFTSRRACLLAAQRAKGGCVENTEAQLALVKKGFKAREKERKIALD